MPTFLKVIWLDVKERRNIELYLALAAIVLVFAADMIGVSRESTLINIVLGVLALLVYSLLESRRSQERVEQIIMHMSVNQSSTSLFTEWDDTGFRQDLDRAKSISLLAIANHVFLGTNRGRIQSFLERGGSIRCVLMDPRGVALPMAADLAFGYDRQSKNLAAQVMLSVEELRELEQQFGQESVQLKFANFLPQAVITILEHRDGDATMYVTLNGVNQPSSARPSFRLRKSVDPKWYSFYQESFENLWQWDQAETIDLETYEI